MRKQNLFLLIAGVMLLLTLHSVAAGGPVNIVTLTAPTNGSAVGGTVTFTATAENATNVTYVYFVGATKTVLCSATNSSPTFTCTASVSGATDSQYNVSVEATNLTISSQATQSNISTANVTVEFDSTLPTVTFSVAQSAIKFGRALPYTCTTSDTLNSSLLNNVTLRGSDGTFKYSTITNIANSEIDPVYFDSYGEWNITCLGKDAVNIGSSSIIFNVRQYDGQAIIVSQTATANKAKSNSGQMLLLLGGGIGVILFVAVILLLANSGLATSIIKKGKK